MLPIFESNPDELFIIHMGLDLVQVSADGICLIYCSVVLAVVILESSLFVKFSLKFVKHSVKYLQADFVDPGMILKFHIYMIQFKY